MGADPTERRRLVIKPLVKPDLDPEKLARIFLERARREIRDDEAA